MEYRKNAVFAAACIGMLMFGVSLLSMGALLPAIIARFHLSGVESGALVSILPLGLLAGSMVFGPIVDRFGYKLLLVLNALIVLAGLEALAFAPSVGVLRLAILAIGFGGGVLNGGTNALVADISAGQRGAQLSLLGVFFGLGALGMPLLLGALDGIAATSIIGTIGAALLLPVLYFLVLDLPVPKHAQGFPIAQGAGLARDGALLAIALTLALQSGIEGVINNWSTTYLQHARGISPRHALLALSAYVGGMTVARVALTGILRTVPGGRVLLSGILVSGAGVAILAWAPGATTAATGLALTGIGLAAAFPLLMGYAADLHPDMSGTAFSVVLAIALPGNMAANYLVGVLSARFGPEHLPLWLGACLALQSGIAVIALRAYGARTHPSTG
jgi:fucose permease